MTVIPILTRALGGPTPTTLNRETRTVEVIALSGPAPVVRPGPAPDGSRTAWIEELSAAGADLSRLRAGPVLKDHRPTTDNAVGAIAEAHIAGDQIVATVRFDGSTAAEELMGKVEAGSVRGVSLGYRVQRWQPAGTRNGLPVYRAVAWIATELSFTPSPADTGATVRSEEDTMTTTTAAPTEEPAQTTKTTETTTTRTTDPKTLTRAQRNAEIRSIGRLSGLGATWIDAQLDSDADLSAVRAAAFSEMQRRSGPTITSVQVIQDNGDPIQVRSAMADALAVRVAPGVVKTLEGRGREFAQWSALDMAAELIRLRGGHVDVRSRYALADMLLTRSGAMSTSDFPLLLEATANKVLMPAYQAAAPTFMKWTAQRGFNDFKPQSYLTMGDFPAMQEITAEKGEVKFGSISEHREKVAAKEWATGISITRRALINDDLGALGDFTSMAAIRVAYDQNSRVYAMVQSNAGAGPALADGNGVFHNSHGNVAGSGATIDETSVNAAIIAMGAMTTLDGLKMNLRPRFIVCGPAKEMAARKLLAAITPATTADVNVWAGQFELIVDANIVGNRWYAFADPAIAPVFVHGYVNGGQSAPTAKSEIDFDTLAVKVRVGLDWGYGAIDFRGAYTNAGA